MKSLWTQPTKKGHFMYVINLHVLHYSSLWSQVEFDEDDPRDPMNFTTARKWTIALTAIAFTALSG